MVYSIKLTHQKDTNLILTRKFFTIAIKNIQLSSHVIKHDETTFSSENLFACVKLPYSVLQQNKFQDQTVSMKNLFHE